MTAKPKGFDASKVAEPEQKTIEQSISETFEERPVPGTEGDEVPRAIAEPETMSQDQIESMIDDRMRALEERIDETSAAASGGRQITDEMILAAQRAHADKMLDAASRLRDRASKESDPQERKKLWNAHYKTRDMVDYATCGVRMMVFRKEFPDGLLYPFIVKQTNTEVLVQSCVYTSREDFQPQTDGEGKPLRNEHGQLYPAGKIAAMDFKTRSTKGQTPPLETAITQAHGRALATFGIALHGGIASAEEVATVSDREEKPAPSPTKERAYSVDQLHAHLSKLLTEKSTILDLKAFREQVGKISSLSPERCIALGQQIRPLKTKEDGDLFLWRLGNESNIAWLTWPGGNARESALGYVSACSTHMLENDDEIPDGLTAALKALHEVDEFAADSEEEQVQAIVDRLTMAVELPDVSPAG